VETRGNHLEKALLLFEQRRYEMAAESLLQVLAASPDDPYPRALLALCRSEMKQHSSAIEEAKLAVSGGPDEAFHHFALAQALHGAGRNDEASRSLEEAIRLDPEDANHFCLLSYLRYAKRDWKGALQAAEDALAREPENVSAANLRAVALVQLGRKDAALDTLGSALEKDPENALTHANRGWALVHERRHREAMENFREALRLDPTLGWAREGIVTALKAHNPIYGTLLRYYLWMSKLSAPTVWLILIGAVALPLLLKGAQRENPELAPYAIPPLLACLAFFFLRWISDPLFNLLVMLHPLGRHALTRREVLASSFVGGLILTALLVLGLAFATGRFLFVMAAAGTAAMTIPVTVTFGSKGVRRFRALLVYTVALALIGLGAFLLELLGLPGALVLGIIFVIGGMLFAPVSQFLR
jgi:tetratricopeptide (TPR) repeat protein